MLRYQKEGSEGNPRAEGIRKGRPVLGEAPAAQLNHEDQCQQGQESLTGSGCLERVLGKGTIVWEDHWIPHLGCGRKVVSGSVMLRAQVRRGPGLRVGAWAGARSWWRHKGPPLQLTPHTHVTTAGERGLLPCRAPSGCQRNKPSFSTLQFSRSVVSDSLWPRGLQHTRPPCPSPASRVYPNHVHWVGDAIQPSHPLSSPSPPAFNLSQHPGLFKWVSSSHRVAKVLEF